MTVGVNNFRPSSAAPLPIAEFLSRSLFPHLPQPSSNEVGDVSSCADDDPSCVERVVTKRQVDPLHSCIEAKCSSWNSGNYLDCVYRHCVTGFQIHGKRSTDAVEQDSDAESFSHPEGRFLLLPVTFQNSEDEPQLFSPNTPEADDEVEETRRALAAAARARLVRRRKSASREDHQEHFHRTALGSKRLRTKRNVAEWNGSRPLDRVERGSLAARLRASLLPKRSYNDIADVCVEHHCSSLAPHTISYFQCVERHCTGK